MNKLEVPTEGVCVGHRCDVCDVCTDSQNPTCCGQDVYEAWQDLPQQGSYEHPIFGELGVLQLENGKVQCHACGEWFKELGKHLPVHGLDSELYRAYFGFALHSPLCSPDVSELRRANGLRATDEHKQELLEHLSDVRPSREQMSIISYRREERLEVKMKRTPHLASIASKGGRAMAEKMRDPIFGGMVRAKRIAARRRHKVYDQRCPYCGWTFCAINYRGSAPITCRSAECRRASKQAAVKARYPGRVS